MIFYSTDKNWILHNRDSKWNKDDTDMVPDSGTMGYICFNFLGIHIRTTVWFRDQHPGEQTHRTQSAVEQLSGLQSLTFLGSLSQFFVTVLFFLHFHIYFSYGYIIVDTNGLQLPYTSNTMNTECMPLISVSLTYLIF